MIIFKKMNNTEITQQVCAALCPSIDIGHLSECDVQDYSWLGMVLFVLSELIGLSHSPSSGVRLNVFFLYIIFKLHVFTTCYTQVVD